MKTKLIFCFALVLSGGMFAFSTSASPTNVPASAIKTNVLPALTNSVLLEIDKGWAYLEELKKQGQLPGVPKASHSTITTGEQPASELKELRYPFVITFLATLTEDTFTNHYTVMQPAKAAAWQLERAWRTDSQGRTIKEWPVASVPRLPATAPSQDLATLAAMQNELSSHQAMRGPLMRELRAAAKYLTELGRSGRLPGMFAHHGHEQLSTDTLPFKEVNFPFVVTFRVNEDGESLTNHYTLVHSAKDAPWQLQRAWRTDAEGHTIKEWPVNQNQTNADSQSSTSNFNSVPTNFVPEHFDLISRRGFRELGKKAANGNVSAQYEVGARYAEGEGVEQNPVQAFKWLQKAARRGNARAEWRAGAMLVAGAGTGTNVDLGLKWLHKAAIQGDVYAQADLGICYFHGKIVPQDEEKAFHWFLAAARQGAPIPERIVGVMYLKGQGTAADVQAGIKWLERAAAQNEPQALYDLGAIYLHGEGALKNAKTAFNYSLKSAIYGENEKRIEADAKANLGMFFITGDGAPKNVRFGLRLLLSAAKDGNLVAQENLGKLFLIAHRYPRAHTWLNRAAHQGSETAEYLLGGMHLEGLAVPTNRVEALKWFYLAAMQGDAAAQDMTGKMLAHLSPAIGKEAITQAKAFKPVKEHPRRIDDSKVTRCPMNTHFLVTAKMFRATKRLLVDTGSGLTTLDEKYRKKLGAPLGQAVVGGAFGTNLNLTIYRSPYIAIGGRPVDGFWVVCSDFGDFSHKIDEPVDGILGMAFLRDHLICFDVGSGTFRVGGSVPNSIKEDAQAIPLKMIPDKVNEFGIDARINGMATVHLLVDSGAVGTAVSLSEQDWRQIFSSGVTSLSTTKVGTLGNQVRTGRIIKLRSVVIGTNRYSNLSAELIPGTKESSVGQEFIRNYVPAIDFPHRVLYLLPSHFTKKP